MSGESTDRQFLPDFIEPAEVNDEALWASQYWGSETPAPIESGPGAPLAMPSKRSGTNNTKRASSFGDHASHRYRSSATRKKPKKYPTWEEKQKRKEKRVAARAQQDAQEREQDPFAHAREIALSYLSSAPRTRSQLMERLSDRGVEEPVALAVIDRLEVVGLVDDEEYARMLVRSRLASRGLARRGLAQELHRKGLTDDVAASALESITVDQELVTARGLVEKKLRTMSRLDDDTKKRRLAGMLARKGYGPHVIWPVLRELVDAQMDPELDDVIDS